MIKELTLDLLDIVVDYVYELNSMKEHQCRPFTNVYTKEAIYLKFSELIEGEHDQVLVSYKTENEIDGVLGIFVEPLELYIQALSGVYAKDDYSYITRKFISYLENHYKGMKMIFAFPIENIDGIKTMDEHGFTQIEDAVIYEYESGALELDDHINIYDTFELDIDELVKFYITYQGEIYWTIDKIMEQEEDWVLKHYVVDEKILGSIFIRLYDDKNAEVFGLLVDKDHQNEGILTELLIAGTKECIYTGIQNIMLFSETTESNNAAINVGYVEVDTHLTFERKL